MRAMRRTPVFCPPARCSSFLLVHIAPGDVGLFRFFLEAYDNLALFTVLESRTALLKLVFSPHQEDEVLEALLAIGEAVTLELSPWPW